MAEPDSKSVTPMRVLAAALAILGVFPLAAVIKWAPVVTWLPLAWREWAASMAAFAILCTLLIRYAGPQVDSILGRAHAWMLRLPGREFAAWAALFTLVGSLLVAWFSFGGHPNAGDEMTQRFQVRILQAGRLSADIGSNTEFFSGIQTAVIDGRWFSQFPIGGAALLALGALFGMPWIINPILAAWTAANVYRFAAGVAGESVGRIATILFVTSPFVLLMSGSQMNHVGTLAFIMLALASLVEWSRAGNANPGWAAFRVGIGFGAAAALRPYDAAAFALVVGGFQLIMARRRSGLARTFPWQLLGGAIPVAILLYANARTTGSPFLFAYDALNGAGHRPGFHVDPMGVDFTPVQGLHHISAYLLLLNASLFGGPIPSLLIVIAALALASRASEWDYLVLTLVGVMLVAYASYWAESFFVGPRFLYSGVPLFVLIAAKLPEGLRSRARTPAQARLAKLVLPLMLVSAWVLPPGVAQYQGVLSALVGTRESNRAQREAVGPALDSPDVENALVLIPESWHGRLAARLRAVGAPALAAESMVRTFDACVLQNGLDAEDRILGSPGQDRVRRVVRRALIAGEARALRGVPGSKSLAFIPNRMLSTSCEEELRQDAEAVSFDQFLPLQTFDRDGHLAGRIVFARDLGLRNEKLLARYADRVWYRYRTGGQSSATLIPYYGNR